MKNKLINFLGGFTTKNVVTFCESSVSKERKRIADSLKQIRVSNRLDSKATLGELTRRSIFVDKVCRLLSIPLMYNSYDGDPDEYDWDIIKMIK